MKRGGPIRRKESIRDGYLRKMKEAKTSIVPKANHEGKRVFWTLKKRKPLKKMSRHRRRKQSDYFAISKEWLSRPENRRCQICAVRGLPLNPSTETHHKRGRAGKLLTDTRFFVSSCRSCREWPHENTKEARALGVLAEPWEWNVYPGEPEACENTQNMRSVAA